MHSKQALFHSAEIFKNRIYFGEQKYIFSGHLELSKTVPKKGLSRKRVHPKKEFILERGQVTNKK